MMNILLSSFPVIECVIIARNEGGESKNTGCDGIFGKVAPYNVHVSVVARTPHDYGITAGISVMLGMIENMAIETESDPSE